MSYRPEFEGAALVQLNGLPKAAFDALVERVAVLVLEPWDAAVIPTTILPIAGCHIWSTPAGPMYRRGVASDGAGERAGSRQGSPILQGEQK